MDRVYALRSDPNTAYLPGMYLVLHLKGIAGENLSDLEWLSLLLNSKFPRIFVESEVHGDGSAYGLPSP